MDKIVCIDNTHRHNYLTTNRTYTLMEGSHTGYDRKNYRVLCDDGKVRWELKKRFVTLEDWRDNQLKQIL